MNRRTSFKEIHNASITRTSIVKKHMYKHVHVQCVYMYIHDNDDMYNVYF